jgi:twitching motility protein PilT
VHIIAGSPVLLRLKGELIPVSLEALDPETAQRMSYSLLTPEQVALFERDGDFDVMVKGAERSRYRVNVSYNDGQVGAVIRLLPIQPRTLRELALPPIVTDLAQARKGMVLITGSTSQGKSTTMAAMVDMINTHFRKHIVTIEDPIEYIHYPKNSIIRQRDIGRDTQSFARGLRAALRQDPDVILIGEMRDYDTIKIALTAAETGVLVISSLHVISIDKLMERLLAYAPEGNDGHMRMLLAESLIGVIHQELLPTTDGGRRVASEILVCTDASRHVMRHGHTFQLRNQIATGRRLGMVTMKSSLDDLLEKGLIAQETYDRVVKNYA